MPAVLAMAAEEVKETVWSVLVTLPDTEDFKSEQQECLGHFITGRDVMAVFTMGMCAAQEISCKLHCTEIVCIFF